MSAVHPAFGGRGGPSSFRGDAGNTITFNLAPAAVQTGLTALASTDGVTAPTASSTVLLGNVDGVLTYTVKITGTGTTTLLTVDSSGNAVTSPTKSTTTFGALTNTAVTSEFTAIAAALGLTAPGSSNTVSVSTTSAGASTYTMTWTSSTSGRHAKTTVISVDDNGNPVGNTSLPFSVFSSTIQNALSANAPSGATTLTSTSLVNVRTINGVTTYSATYLSAGTRTTVTVNGAGKLTSLPNTSTSTFADIPTAAQTELQTLATAKGVSTTIDSSQSVSVYDEGNGLTIYTMRLAATTTTASGATYTYYISLSVDQNGDPAVLPSGANGGNTFCV
jgi:hypothetical protein